MGKLEECQIIRPSGELDVDVCCQSEFSVLWPYKDKQGSTCANICTGLSSAFQTVGSFVKSNSRLKYTFPPWK